MYHHTAIVFVLVDPAAPFLSPQPSAVTINLPLPNPVFTKAFINVPAEFPLAESTLVEIPGPVWGWVSMGND
jgi:hypothetical protein